MNFDEKIAAVTTISILIAFIYYAVSAGSYYRSFAS